MKNRTKYCVGHGTAKPVGQVLSEEFFRVNRGHVVELLNQFDRLTGIEPVVL